MTAFAASKPHILRPNPGPEPSHSATQSRSLPVTGSLAHSCTHSPTQSRTHSRNRFASFLVNSNGTDPFDSLILAETSLYQ